MTKKSIIRLLGFNIENLPDDSFFEDSYQINTQGTLLKNYSKYFFDSRYKIFDRIEIRDFDGICKNVSFICSLFKENNYSGIKRLINDLRNIYGRDSLGRGRYRTHDFLDLKNERLEFYDLRDWIGVESKIEPMSLYFDREGNSMTLIIYGVGLFKNKAASEIS